MSKRPIWKLAYVQEMGACYHTPVGVVEYIKIRRHDGKRMTWRQVWETFAAAYPGRWALEVYPPDTHLVDEANIYHLFVLPEGQGLGHTDLNIDHRHVHF